MGIVLRRAFKGTHLWVPSIEKQLQDMDKIKKNAKTNPVSVTFLDQIDTSICKEPRFNSKNNHHNSVKIDSMFFTASEEKVVLIGDEDQISDQ